MEKHKLLAIALGGSIGINVALTFIAKAEFKAILGQLKRNTQLLEFSKLLVKIIERENPNLIVDPEIEQFMTNWEFDKIITDLKDNP